MADDAADDRPDREATARACARLEQIARLLGRRVEDFFELPDDGARGEEPPKPADDG